MKNLKYINKYFLKYKWSLIWGGLITIIARVFAVVMPEYVQISMDAVQRYVETAESERNQRELTNQIIKYIAIIIGSALLSGFFTYLMRQLIINVSRYIEFDLKNEIFDKYQSLTTRFYKENRTGDLMNRISEDVGKVRMYAGPAIMYGLQTVTLFLCIIPLMIYTSAKLTLYSLLPLPFLSVFIYHISININKRTKEVQEFLSNLSTFTQENFSGIGVIKANAMECDIDKKMTLLSEIGKEKNLKLAKVQSLFGPSMIFLMGISTTIVIFIGGSMYISGEIQSVGVIAKFSIYMMMLTFPVTSVGWISSITQQAEASQKRINEFLSEKIEIENNTEDKTEIKGNLEFKNVSFTYPDTKITALKNISFEIPVGKSVAIVGKTGSGKSTVLELITRCYDTTQGEVLIDGKNIKEININSIRESISVVPQESFLFSDTIGNNIRFGNSKASEKEIEKAAQLAEVHSNIVNFKDGYDTVLGERGVSLSGGQKQRVCIARAIVKPAQIYLFDDCLSAVDAETEEKIITNLNNTAVGKTKIIVSHRVSVAKGVDHIIMLEDGEIVEQGNHKMLYEKKGAYRKYYDLQELKK